MAKGAITKKRKGICVETPSRNHTFFKTNNSSCQSLAPSLHSRAARRATSPGIDTDKSLKNVQPPPESVDHRPSILAIHSGAGVAKKQKKNRAMSSRARKRYEKAQDRAAAVMERTEKKVALSKDQSKAIQHRRKVWDEINQTIPLNNSKAESKEKVHADEESTDESEFDDEMGVAKYQHRNHQQSDADEVDMARPDTETAMNQDGGDDDGIL